MKPPQIAHAGELQIPIYRHKPDVVDKLLSINLKTNLKKKSW